MMISAMEQHQNMNHAHPYVQYNAVAAVQPHHDVAGMHARLPAPQ
ncbi:hypothetical protein A2U01_0054701 [Trifolium medium]|uniref:Uncharacterized protein n=1 Tax=Trifolium medium TaxID=97028 RepID=A0A392RBT5_9FABA|nr:hypothetical protein [Trifolium medium]